MADSNAQRRTELANQLAVAADLVTEPGWAGVVEGLLSDAADKVARLELDEFEQRFHEASKRIDLALNLLGREFTMAAALAVLDDLFAETFDPLGFTEPESRFESDAETINRIERDRRFEAGE